MHCLCVRLCVWLPLTMNHPLPLLVCLQAANYLNIKSLLDLTCLTVRAAGSGQWGVAGQGCEGQKNDAWGSASMLRYCAAGNAALLLCHQPRDIPRMHHVRACPFLWPTQPHAKLHFGFPVATSPSVYLIQLMDGCP